MTIKRRLPAQFNHLLAENDPSKDELVELRRLGRTKLTTAKTSPPATGAGANAATTPQTTLFSYVHLRAPLPNDINPEMFGNDTKPEAYFLMRRSKDGYVSSTGMFKASFPWATKADEDLERRYVKSHFHTSTEETAGNLWVHPDDALSLASEYRCQVWIEALVDERPVNSDSHRNKAVTPPPPYTVESLDPAPIKAASPVRKIAQPRKSRLAKAAATKDLSASSDLQTEKASAPAPSTKAGTPISNGDATINNTATSTTAIATVTSDTVKTEETEETVETVETVLEEKVVANPTEDPNFLPESVSEAVVKSETADEDTKAEVVVETTTKAKGDIVVESTHVKVEVQPLSDALLLPESPEEMIARAKEMVDEAMRDIDEPPVSKKRKIENTSSPDIPDIDTLEIDSPKKSKRARVIDVLKEEKFQQRALIGLGATVAIGGLAFFSNLL